MKNSQSTDPLRRPKSVKAELERRANEEGTRVNRFVATAVAATLSAMNTEALFAERRDRADVPAFDRLTRRKGGELPRPDDRVVGGWQLRSGGLIRPCHATRTGGSAYPRIIRVTGSDA